MLTYDDLRVIASALVVQEKSVNRLAAKDGQPETVAAEYRKVSLLIVGVMRKINLELEKLAESAAVPVKDVSGKK